MSPVVHSICTSKHDALVAPIVDRVGQLEDSLPNALALRGEIGQLRREIGDVKGAVSTVVDEVGLIRSGLQHATERLDGRDQQMLEMLGRALRRADRASESLTDIVVDSRSAKRKRMSLRYKLLLALAPAIIAVAGAFGRATASVQCSPAPAAPAR